MRNRLVITLCAVVSLLAGAGLLTFWLVRSLAPAAALNYTPWPLSPEPYTQADLDEALALRTEGYEAQSVAAFDRALADWTNEAAFHAREERIRRLLCSYEEDGPEAEFVLGTLAAAMGACSDRHYGGYCTQITPAYADAAAYTRSEDVFGDSYVVYEASASYTIRYQMPDESRLTVGERDRILTRYRQDGGRAVEGGGHDPCPEAGAETAGPVPVHPVDGAGGHPARRLLRLWPGGGRDPVRLSALSLKLIAIAAMVVDHIAFTFVPYGTPLWTVMDAAGKLTGPIMFYMAVEGFHHTRSIRRYLARLSVFAGVSYFPFLYFCAMGQPEQMDPLRLNVIYTILLGVLAVWVRRRPWPAPLRAVLLLLLACLSIPGDWGIWGFSIIVVLDFYYGDFRNQAFGYTLVVLFAVNTVSLLTGPAYDLLYLGGLSSPADYLLGVENLGMFLPLLLLRYYDGTRGTDRPWGKWLFYLFYPAHLLLLGLLAHILR